LKDVPLHETVPFERPQDLDKHLFREPRYATLHLAEMPGAIGEAVEHNLFETIVQQCVNVGLVQGERLSVDGTVIAADASSKSRVSREQLPEAAKVSRTLREYLAEVETANPTPSSENQTPPEDSGKISSSDPDATWATKGGVPAQLSYYDNYLIDNESNIILDVEATPARFS